MKKQKIIVAVILVMALFLTGCGNKSKYKTIGKPLLSEEFSIGFRSGDKLGEYVAAALKVLAGDGTLADLSREWFGRDITMLKGDSSALDAYFEEGIPGRRIIVGVDAGSAPMSFKDAYGRLTGFDIDLARYIVSKLGWTADFHEIMESDMVAQLNSGNVDCVIGGMNTSAGGSKISSSPAYLGNEKLLVALPDSGVSSRRDLEGRALAMTFDPLSDRALTSAEGLRDTLGSIKKMDSSLECLESLEAGGCDAVIVDSLALEYYESN